MKRTKLHALNPESARKRIKAAKSNKQFVAALLDREYRGHIDAVDQWTRLHQAAFPESAGAQQGSASSESRSRSLVDSGPSTGTAGTSRTIRHPTDDAWRPIQHSPARGRDGAGNGEIRRVDRHARLLQRPGKRVRQAEGSIEEQEDWSENWFARGRHFYDRISPPVCDASECSLEDVVAALNETGVHPNQSKEFVPGQPYVGDVDLHGPFGRDDVSTTAIFEDGAQVGVRNETQENHKLHPGTVERTVILKDGSYHIRTQGEGTGRFGKPNILLDDYVWGKVDRQVIDAFR